MADSVAIMDTIISVERIFTCRGIHTAAINITGPQHRGGLKNITVESNKSVIKTLVDTFFIAKKVLKHLKEELIIDAPALSAKIAPQQ